MKLLVQWYSRYAGKWDDDVFAELIKVSGFNKKQLNKWFWDRKKKERENLKNKRLSYPGLIFEITDTRTGRDLTPSFKVLAVNKPLFRVDKVIGI